MRHLLFLSTINIIITYVSIYLCVYKTKGTLEKMSFFISWPIRTPNWLILCFRLFVCLKLQNTHMPSGGSRIIYRYGPCAQVQYRLWLKDPLKMKTVHENEIIMLTKYIYKNRSMTDIYECVMYIEHAILLMNFK